MQKIYKSIIYSILVTAKALRLPHIFKYILFKLVEGQTFIDIGANVGNFSLSLYDVAPKVLALEASSHCCSQIKSSIAQNNIKNIEVINAAIFNKTGSTIDLFVGVDTFGNSSIFEMNKQQKTEKVSTITIDDVCRQSQLQKVGLLKIDIEDAELVALQGAKHTLSELKPDLVLELNQPVAKIYGQDVRELYSLLQQHGYSSYELRAGQLIPFSLPTNYQNINQNVFFTQNAI